LESFLAVIVAIDLEVPTPRLASARERITGLQSAFERSAHLCPIAGRFDFVLVGPPLAWSKLRQQLRLNVSQGSAQHERQIAQFTVVRKKRDQHLEVGNEADRFKVEPVIWNLLSQI